MMFLYRSRMLNSCCGKTTVQLALRSVFQLTMNSIVPGVSFEDQSFHSYRFYILAIVPLPDNMEGCLLWHDIY